MSVKNILITGGNGFLGKNITENFLLQNYNVKVYDKLERKDYSHPNLTQITGDFITSENIDFALTNIDIVIHLINTTVPCDSSPMRDIDENLKPMIKFLDKMVVHNISKLMFVSTGGAVYGNIAKQPVAEDDPKTPISSYGMIKLIIEDYIRMYSKLHNFEYIIIRPCNIFGYNSGNYGRQGIITTFIDNIINEKSLKVWGDGSVVRDYIFIDDFVEFINKAIIYSGSEIFNVGSGRGTSVNEIISIIKCIIKADSLDIKYSDARNYDVQKIVLDSSKALKLLNWIPKITIEKGIRMLWSELSNNKNSLE